MTIAELARSSVHTEPGPDARRYERFIIQKAGMLLAINSRLSGLTSRSCTVQDISKGGACLRVTTAIGLPDHYYLSFIGFDYRIGSAEVYRNDVRIGVRFIKPLPDELLSRIVRNDFFTAAV